MSGNVGLNMITDGLVVHLDVANNKSYISGNTTWNNIVDISNSFTLYNQPVYNSNNYGNLVFNGNTTYGASPSFVISSATSALTFNIVCTSFSSSTTQSLIGKETNVAGVPHILLRRYSNSNALGYNFQYNNGVSSGTTAYIINNFFNDGAWVCLQISANYSNSSIKTYKNGVLFDQGSISNSQFPNTNSPMYISSFSIPNFLHWSGSVAYVSIYNRELSVTEITQNYNAIKKRFNL